MPKRSTASAQARRSPRSWRAPVGVPVVEKDQAPFRRHAALEDGIQNVARRGVEIAIHMQHREALRRGKAGQGVGEPARMDGEAVLGQDAGHAFAQFRRRSVPCRSLLPSRRSGSADCRYRRRPPVRGGLRNCRTDVVSFPAAGSAAGCSDRLCCRRQRRRHKAWVVTPRSSCRIRRTSPSTSHWNA